MGVTLAIRAVVAATFAAACIAGAVVGFIVVAALGMIALACCQPAVTDMASSQSPTLGEFGPWILCIALFVFFILAFAPFADLPAIVFACLFLSPLIGAMVLTASTALCGLTRRL